MAAYLYFEFDSTDVTINPYATWVVSLSNGGGSSGGGTITAWNLIELNTATNFTFDSVTLVDLGGGQFRYKATYNVTEGYDLNDISQSYPSQLDNRTNIFVAVRLFDSSVTPPADLIICDECRNITLQACADSYKIVAGLTPFTIYFVTIQDRNNDLYIQEITSDGNGDVTIDATSPEFPAGFWLTESGNKVIKIYSDEELTEIEDITVDTTVYSCVLLNLQYYYTTTT